MGKVLGMILAGGEGRRLWPLTADRAKPAVPFGGKYRLIDFVLSNFAHSGFLRLKVLTQYKSESLNVHISRGWRLSTLLDNYIEVVPPQQRINRDWYKGSADAIYQNLNLITDEKPSEVFVFGADHVYRMDLSQMLRLHRKRGVACTVAALPVPINQAHQFGVIEIDPNWMMVGFDEKPKNPKCIPGRPDLALVSMGNYLFDTATLVAELTRDAATESSHDFGRDILTGMLGRYPIFIYDFLRNEVPGQEGDEKGYWRDVGTIDAYWQAQMDLVSVKPVFSLYNKEWPLLTFNQTLPPAKFVFDDPASQRQGLALNSMVSDGCIVSGGRLRRCVLSPEVRVNSYSELEECVVFDGVQVGRRSRLRRCIIDKNVNIPPDTVIGYDPAADRARFTVSDNGVVVIPKGYQF
ncbi:MAG: glucose-1-phosphate adenylyltransferase [Myxococcota bacterium]